MTVHAAELVLASGLVLTLAGIGALTVGVVIFGCARELAERLADWDAREAAADVLALGGHTIDHIRSNR